MGSASSKAYPFSFDKVYINQISINIIIIVKYLFKKWLLNIHFFFFLI